MHARYMNITKAYRNVIDSHRATFDWIFSEDGPGFAQWLKDGKGVYWIYGKAGSGKSTLMKFISSD